MEDDEAITNDSAISLRNASINLTEQVVGGFDMLLVLWDAMFWMCHKQTWDIWNAWEIIFTCQTEDYKRN